jgi:hypothetical protein
MSFTVQKKGIKVSFSEKTNVLVQNLNYFLAKAANYNSPMTAQWV